jgi:hypothetical protein
MRLDVRGQCVAAPCWPDNAADMGFIRMVCARGLDGAAVRIRFVGAHS